MAQGIDKKQDRYLHDFSRSEKHLTGSGLSWIRKSRQLAMERFAELGFPTDQDEEWRFTNLDSLVEMPFVFDVGKRLEGWKAKGLKDFTFNALKSCQLVFVNGCYLPEFSSIPLPLGGVQIESLSVSLTKNPGRLEPYLTRYADVQKHSFTALNTAFWNDGAFVYVPRGQAVEVPIRLLFVSTRSQEATVSCPRVLVVAEQDSKATVVESYVGVGKGVYFTNAVTEVIVGENATVDHYKLQQENMEAFHMATLQVHQGRNSSFTSHSISLGGALVRNDIGVALDAEGVECTLNGLYRLMGRQHVDYHTTIDHVKPHGNSRELYKGILDGTSRGVFNGKIIVRPDAQKTDALQTNKNLLLSDGAMINTKPQLEIFANDVKCKHGATIGQIDPEVLFYLRSRGIDREAARHLLIYAFANEMIDKIRIEPIREILRDSFLTSLSGDQRA